jgi:hypothetical protein
LFSGFRNIQPYSTDYRSYRFRIVFRFSGIFSRTQQATGPTGVGLFFRFSGIFRSVKKGHRNPYITIKDNGYLKKYTETTG